jgi:hypothetical protein
LTPSKAKEKKRPKNVSPDGPALWLHSEKVFDVLAKGAVLTELDEGNKQKVWTGAVTAVHSQLRIPTPHYGPAMKFLKDMGCIDVLRRGNSHQDSMIAIFRKPTRAEFDDWNKKARRKKVSSGTGDFEVLNQKISDLRDSLGGIDIKKALIEKEKQIKALEKEVRGLKGKIEKLEKGLDSKPAKRVSSTQKKTTTKQGGQK